MILRNLKYTNSDSTTLKTEYQPRNEMPRRRRAKVTTASAAAVAWSICVHVIVTLPLMHLSSGAAIRRHATDDAANRTLSRSAQMKHEAIERLSRVFGITKVPEHSHHRAPPQFMLDLYHIVADPTGITKTSSPFDADVVRGFPDRDTVHHMHFYFNVTYIESSENLLQAEFHLFKLRPRYKQYRSWPLRHLHLIELRVYEVLEEDSMHSLDHLGLLDVKRISAYSHGWEVFNVTTAAARWVNDSTANHGFLVTATSRSGHHVNGTHIRFAQRSQHHDSKQPVLVVFTEERNKPRRISSSGPDYMDWEDESVVNEWVRAKPFRRNQAAAMFLNEKFRSSRGGFRNYKALDLRSLQHTRPKLPAHELQSYQRRSKRAVNYPKLKERKRTTCRRHELYVDFDEVGWSGWIISPKGYNAYHCKGECPFPLGQNQKPTNHATVQSIVHALRISKDVTTPCCVPNKLYSISLLYFDDEENVILKQYDEMVAAGCGCH